jgi:hypothetical protein
MGLSMVREGYIKGMSWFEEMAAVTKFSVPSLISVLLRLSPFL